MSDADDVITDWDSPSLDGDDEMEDVRIVEIGRGLRRYGDLLWTRSEQSLRVQDSSAAEEPCVWLFVDDLGTEPVRTTGIHMTAEQARALRDRIDAWLDAQEPLIDPRDTGPAPLVC